MTRPQLGPSRRIAGSHIFDLRMSHSGYRLNKMCDSLCDLANREAFKADEEAYMERFDLPAAQRELVRKRDFAALVESGGSIYYLIKLGVLTGSGLYRIGAQMRGETHEAFMASRKIPGAV